MARLTFMRGEELIQKLLQGERDFSHIRLEQRFKLGLHEGFGELQSYLRSQDLERSPVILEGAELKGLDAGHLYLPFVRGKDADLTCAYLYHADFHGAAFPGAKLYFALLNEADCRRATFDRAYMAVTELRGTDFSYASMRGAHLPGTRLDEAILLDTDLEGAIMVRADLKGADMRQAKVTGADLYEATDVAIGDADLRGGNGQPMPVDMPVLPRPLQAAAAITMSGPVPRDSFIIGYND